jgi:hypothetical protein
VLKQRRHFIRSEYLRYLFFRYFLFHIVNYITPSEKHNDGISTQRSRDVCQFSL